MGIVRLVLSVFLCISGYFLYEIVGLRSASNPAKILWCTIFGILFFWALFMLLSLLFKVKTETDGSICLVPGNPILIVREKVSSVTKGSFRTFSGSEFKPCPLYWGLSLLSFTSLFALLLVAGLSYALLIAPFFGDFSGLILLGTLTCLVLLIWGSGDVIKMLRYRYMKMTDYAFLLGMSAVFFCIAIALSILAGILEVLLALACIVLTLSIIIFTICSVGLVFQQLQRYDPHLIPSFENWLGNTIDWLDSIYVIRIKPRFCPTVKKCD